MPPDYLGPVVTVTVHRLTKLGKFALLVRSLCATSLLMAGKFLVFGTLARAILLFLPDWRLKPSRTALLGSVASYLSVREC